MRQVSMQAEPGRWIFRAGGRRLTQRGQEAVAGYLFAAPWLIGLLLLTAIPAISSIYFSLTEYQLVKPPTFVGLQNYQQLLTGDPRFVKAIVNTVFMVILGVPLNMVVGLLVALLLNQKLRGLAIYRTIFFLPSQVSGVALAVLWGWILNPQFGIVAQVLGAVGIQAPVWLADPDWVKPAFVLMGLWSIGTSMIIWLAGLQSIPDTFYEAAEIDGANRMRRFWSITLPLLTPTVFFTLTTGIIGSFQIFTQAFVLTTGGPNDATLFYALYIYQEAFQFFQMGYACALAWVLFALVLVVTLINLKTARSWVYYEAVKE
ncbi:MAG TPA: sugar ABC transporter permease [Chloroflexota bacterium]|nr:sugar ABC transporter permease [Chloroflexota bacterium]